MWKVTQNERERKKLRLEIVRRTIFFFVHSFGWLVGWLLSLLVFFSTGSKRILSFGFLHLPSSTCTFPSTKLLLCFRARMNKTNGQSGAKKKHARKKCIEIHFSFIALGSCCLVDCTLYIVALCAVLCVSVHLSTWLRFDLLVCVFLISTVVAVVVGCFFLVSECVCVFVRRCCRRRRNAFRLFLYFAHLARVHTMSFVYFCRACMF